MFLKMRLSLLLLASVATVVLSKKKSPVIVCHFDLIPHCGSDGVTYDSSCSFKVAQNANPDLKLVHRGDCSKKNWKKAKRHRKHGRSHALASKSTPDRKSKLDFATVVLSKKNNPVIVCHLDLIRHCGSDGVTYDSSCSFKLAQYENPDLKLVHQGDCSNKDWKKAKRIRKHGRSHARAWW